MNLRSVLVVTATSLVGVALAATAQAQPVEEIVVKIPFSFIAGTATFPAGNYTVDVGTSIDPCLMTLESQSGANYALLLGLPGGESREGVAPKLEFTRVGGRYYLKQVDPGDGMPDLGVPRAPAATASGQRPPAPPAL